jgi:hypothetical protein
MKSIDVKQTAVSGRNIVQNSRHVRGSDRQSPTEPEACIEKPESNTWSIGTPYTAS